jgi:hypothetical protein
MSANEGLGRHDRIRHSLLRLQIEICHPDGIRCPRCSFKRLSSPKAQKIDDDEEERDCQLISNIAMSSNNNTTTATSGGGSGSIFGYFICLGGISTTTKAVLSDDDNATAECCAELLDLELIDCNENCNYIDVCNPPDDTVEPTPPPSPTTTLPPVPAAIETTFELTYGSSPLGSGVESFTHTTVVLIVTPAPTPLTSIGSTPTVGKEKMDVGYVNLGPRR